MPEADVVRGMPRRVDRFKPRRQPVSVPESGAKDEYRCAGHLGETFGPGGMIGVPVGASYALHGSCGQDRIEMRLVVGTGVHDRALEHVRVRASERKRSGVGRPQGYKAHLEIVTRRSLLPSSTACAAPRRTGKARARYDPVPGGEAWINGLPELLWMVRRGARRPRGRATRRLA